MVNVKVSHFASAFSCSRKFGTQAAGDILLWRKGGWSGGLFMLERWAFDVFSHQQHDGERLERGAADGQ